MAAESSFDAATIFFNTTLEFFDFTVGMIEDLHTDGLVGTSAESLALPRKLIEAYDAEMLTGFFLDCYKDWHHIAARNDQFILEIMPAAYVKIPFNVSLLTIPLDYYRNYAMANKLAVPLTDFPPTPERTAAEKQANWPILSEDIGFLWDYFFTMVHAACTYTIVTRRTDRQFRPEVDVPAVVAQFGLKDVPLR